MKNMFYMLANKGVKFSEDTVFKILNCAASTEGFEVNGELLDLIKASVHPYNAESIERRFNELPRAQVKDVEPAAPEEASQQKSEM
jgi:hypothetical protein